MSEEQPDCILIVEEDDGSEEMGSEMTTDPENNVSNLPDVVSQSESVLAKFISNAGTSNNRKLKFKSVYTCSQCDATFSKKSVFAKHAIAHCLNKCERCGKTFNNKENLVIHVQTHDEEPPAPLRKKGTAKKTKKVRKRSSAEPNWTLSHKCETCGKKFKLIENFEIHLQIHKESVQEDNQREDKEASEPGTVASAIPEPPLPDVKEQPEKCQERTETSSKERPYSCKHCGKTYGKIKSLAAHLKIHTGVKAFPCLECSKSFMRATDLKKHELKHSSDMPFNCSQCPRRFRRLQNLQSHIKTIHQDEKDKPFPCEVCQKRFVDKIRLKAHMLVHSGKRHPCELCDRDFSLKSTLDVHMLSHTGGNPCLCELCGRSFPAQSHLRKHMMVHTGERPFPCTMCKKKFRDSSGLNLHLSRVHLGARPFMCEICGKGNATQYHLKRHLLSHTELKPFHCETCGKGFRQKGSLKVHRVVHSGERNFSCLECGKTFTQNSTLTLHKKTHHGQGSTTTTSPSKGHQRRSPARHLPPQQISTEQYHLMPISMAPYGLSGPFYT